MPLCKIRTSRLTYREIYRICGAYGFPLVTLLKMLRRDVPSPECYLAPCFWADMHISPDGLSDEVRRHLASVHSTCPPGEGPWECHFFQRPHRAAIIVDSGGAFFFAPGSRLHLMHACAQAANGRMASYTYVVSFRQNGHTIATTNNQIGFDSVPGSECHSLPGSSEALVARHRDRIYSNADLAIFHTFLEFTEAYDRKEKIQSDWDLARGAYAPAN